MDPSTADFTIMLATESIFREQAAALLQRSLEQTEAEYRAAVKCAALGTTIATLIDDYIGERSALEIRVKQ